MNNRKNEKKRKINVQEDTLLMGEIFATIKALRDVVDDTLYVKYVMKMEKKGKTDAFHFIYKCTLKNECLCHFSSV